MFFKRIMIEALDGHVGTFTIGGRQLTNLRFADAIDILVGSEREFRQIVSRIERPSKDYGMKINGGKTKLMTTINMRDCNITLILKTRLTRSLVISIILYYCPN